jgi:hypothetical protein
MAYQFRITHDGACVTHPPPQNSGGSLIIYYKNFRTINSTGFSFVPFQSYKLSNDTPSITFKTPSPMSHSHLVKHIVYQCQYIISTHGIDMIH